MQKLLEKAANENFAISVDELEKFADTKIDNIRILVTPNQLRSIKKSKKTKPIIQKRWQDRFHPFRVECELPTKY